MKPVWRTLVGVSILATLSISLSSFAETESRLSLSQASFVSPDFEMPQKKDYQFISVGVDTLAGFRTEEEIDNSLQAEVRGLLAPGSSVLNYLNVSQLYWRQNQISVGRKKMIWSDLDERFNLGSYQPVFKWNPLQWESQGLTGIFLHIERDDQAIPWQFTAFGSPVFIPNQGAGYEIQNGSFEESNPYFRAPPAMVIMNNQEFKIHYEVMKPKTEEVVFRQSLAAQAVLGRRDKGASAQVAYANKPNNELNLGVIPYAPAFNQKLNVEIQPGVSSHTLLSADVKFADRFFEVGVSGLHETPKDPKFEDEITYARYNKSTLVSPNLLVRIQNFDVELSYLSVQGGELETVGPNGQLVSQFFPERYPFQNATQGGLKYQYRFKRFQKLALATKYLRGAEGEFDLWTAQASYQWQERWAASLMSQMIHVENNSKGQQTAYNSYLNNDLVALGVSYVF